ncbi:molecular chaperone HtpG, partial [Aliarcobacter cryaerophilus]
EVLILDDKEIDEIITPTIGAFKEWQFTDITTAQAPKVEVNEEEKQKIEEEFKDIVSKIKDKLGSEVKDVKITSRLDSFASCITKDAGDAQMAAMAHMFRAMGQEAPEIKPILEINPNHEIVKKLQSSTNDELIEDVSWILLDLAKISEGVDVSDKVAFAKRLTKITSLAM